MIGKDEQGVVSSGSGWKPALLVTVGKCDSICLRIKDSIPTSGWKPVPRQIAYCSLLIAHSSLLSVVLASSQRCGRRLLPRRQMQSHFPTVTKSAGFQPEQLLITHCSKLIAHYSLLQWCDAHTEQMDRQMRCAEDTTLSARIYKLITKPYSRTGEPHLRVSRRAVNIDEILKIRK